MGATSDGSRMVVALCHRAGCGPRSAFVGTGPTPSTRTATDLYESTDGGITWSHLDTLPGIWGVRKVFLDGRVMLAGADDFSEDRSAYLFNPNFYMRYPDGERWNWDSPSEEVKSLLAIPEREFPQIDELEINEERTYCAWFRPGIRLSESEIIGQGGFLGGSILTGGEVLGDATGGLLPVFWAYPGGPHVNHPHDPYTGMF